jgi:hypothetical protein
MSGFHHSMRRFHRRWSLGRLMSALLIVITILALGMLAHGLADFAFALPSAARETINGILLALVAILTVVWIYRIVKTPHQTLAAMLDEQRGDPRRQLTAAADLDTLEPETDMQKFHLDHALGDAARQLEILPRKFRMPFKTIGMAACGLLLVAALVTALRSWASEPFRVTTARIMNPRGDIPPYSPLRFEVTPGDLQSLYGGEAVAQVAISGGEITEEVYCLIRDPQTGRIERTTAYQESPGHYARKFSATLTSADFSFATGRARSAWHQLEVLLQPKVSEVTVSIEPPAYADRTAETFALESGEIKVLEGSTVTMRVRSNRPLSGGLLSVRPLGASSDAVPTEIQGSPSDLDSVEFSWPAHASSLLSATIKDIRSTPSEQALELNLVVIPDQAPVVALTSPEQLVLATPHTELPFEADVEDDHGLAKVSMVRALVGYRDRNRTLADSLARMKFEFQESLKLQELGVEIGQVLEFYLEAMDRNPSLLGRGVSEVVRVKIISEDDYAERIRAKVVLEEFTARYQALSHAVQEARKSLEALDKAADLGNKQKFEEARKNAEAAHAEAADLAAKLAKDFKAFAMEDRLADMAAEAAEKLNQNAAELGQLDLAAGEGTTRKAIAGMQDRLGGVQEKAEQIELDAEVVVKVGRVMEMAAEFRKIQYAQQSLTERLDAISREVAKGNTTNTALLANLGRQQDKNREALEHLAVELKARSEALPPGFEQMQRDVGGFLQMLKQLDISNPMQAASEAAAKGKTTDASANAALALALLERLVNQPDNGF